MKIYEINGKLYAFADGEVPEGAVLKTKARKPDETKKVEVKEEVKTEPKTKARKTPSNKSRKAGNNK